MLPSITGMFLWLSKTNNRAFRRSKTVSNILIRCPNGSDEITIFVFLCESTIFPQNSTQLHKLLIWSETLRHRMKMSDTVLEPPKVILLVLESHRTISANLGNTRSTYENALQSSEFQDFLKFKLRYLSIEEGYRYVRHGVGKPCLYDFLSE